MPQSRAPEVSEPTSLADAATTRAQQHAEQPIEEPPQPMNEPPRLPKGVVEVIPDLLYVGGEAAAKDMLCKWGIRRVVRCCEDGLDYDKEYINPPKKEVFSLDEIVPTKKDKKDADDENKKAEEEKQNEEPEEEEEEVPQGGIVGVGKAAVKEPSKMEEIPDATAEPNCDGCDAGCEACNEEDEEEEEPYTGPAPLSLMVHHCPMEDTLEFDIGKCVPKALDFMDAVLSQSKAAKEDEAEALENEKKQERDPECAVCAKDDLVIHAKWVDSLNPEERMRYEMRYATYVHCSAGVSRSPTLVAAYLLLRENKSLQTIFDEIFPDTCRPNPSFINQLMMLESENSGERSTFDIKRYYLEGLIGLFPQLEESVIENELERCKYDVLQARQTLMKRSMLKMDRNRAMIQSLHSIMKGAFSMEVVEKVYNEKNKNRDAALMELMRRDAEEAEVRAQEEKWGQREKSTL